MFYPTFLMTQAKVSCAKGSFYWRLSNQSGESDVNGLNLFENAPIVLSGVDEPFDTDASRRGL
ncbi:MAG: hypothetical protein DMG13_22285 [Acidobacteria bacterium]|nr:MAG: hypothetical protein DMG13_22285 [Acidobacteriota bacterium]